MIGGNLSQYLLGNNSQSLGDPQWLSAQAQVMALGAQQSGKAPSHLVRRKADIAIDEVLRQLPFKVVNKITYLNFTYPQMTFVLKFESGHTMEFGDANEFPTDADIGRICLESSI